MKNKKNILRLVLVLFVALGMQAFGQITPLGDSYTNSAHPAANYGSAPLLYVNGDTETTYIQFNLASIPEGATVSQATLKLYVNGVTTAGSFNVDYVNGSWSESTITHNLAPALGSTIVSDVPITTADINQYILINVTSAVQAWLSGSETNDGIALVANSTFNASFDSKENTGTSHPAELDIVFAGITGVETPPGSGLQGSGTSGTLNLSLTNTCATNQVLEWNGTAWACSSPGMGTITGVTAGADLTGGGSSGTVTLNLDTTKVPLLAAANTFTGNQTVNGNLSATGVVTGSGFQIGSNLFDYGSFGPGNAFLGFAGNTSMTGSYNTAVGQQAFSLNTTGGENTAVGRGALSSNTTGSYNTAGGTSALLLNTAANYNTAFGFLALASENGPGGAEGESGGYNTATGYEALYFNLTGSANTATGYQALLSNTTLSGESGSGNTATGYQALYSNTTGQGNTATGQDALAANLTAFFNTATGQNALSSNTTGQGNTATGSFALESNTTGFGNTATGYQALYYNISGVNLTCMGVNCYIPDGLYNATAIGAYAAVEESNALVLGSIKGVNNATANVNVGIGTTTPTNVFTIGQTYGHAIADGWDTYSSRRWKTNIKTLHNALGKVEQLRGVSYDLKDFSKHEIGVIAEEVGQVVPEVVSYEKNGKDATGVDYSRLTALLIEAVKQQQLEISALRRQLRNRAAKEAALESRLERLEQDRGQTQLASAHPVR